MVPSSIVMTAGRRRAGRGPKTAVAVLPDGRDALTTFAFDEMDGSTTMYFDRINCRNGNSGIFRIPDADTAGLP